MFNNIGGKIKTLSVVVTLIGIVASIIIGIAFITNEEVLIGFVVMLAGSFISWISSFVLYGFGELICNSDKIAKECNEIRLNMNSDDKGGISYATSAKSYVRDTDAEQLYTQYRETTPQVKVSDVTDEYLDAAINKAKNSLR